MSAAPPIQIIAEILINNTWRDISRFVYQRDNIQITGGKQDQDTSKPDPAKITLTLNNRDGRFSPNYAVSPYWPNLTRMVPFRLALSFTNGNRRYDGYRFWGKVFNWPVTSDQSGKDVFVQITASGPLRQLHQKTTKDSALIRYYTQLTGALQPIAYWPCEENPNSKTIGAALTGGQNMQVTSGTPIWKAVDGFNGSAPVPIVNNSTWVGQTGSTGAAPSFNVLRAIVFVPTTGGNDGRVIMRWNTTGTITKIDLHYIKGGKLQVKGYNNSGTKKFDSSSRPHQIDGAPVMVSIELSNSGANLNWSLKTVQAGSHQYNDNFSGTVTTAQCGLVTQCTVDPNRDITRTAIAQISVQYALQDLLAVSAYISEALNAHDGEMSLNRFVRLMSEEAMAAKVIPKKGTDHWDFDVNDNILSPQHSVFTGGIGKWGPDSSNATASNANADNLVFNPFFTENPPLLGWNPGSNTGTQTLTLDTNPPTGCPTPQAAKLVASGASTAYIQNTNFPWPSPFVQPCFQGQTYQVQTVVYSSVNATMQCGASLLDVNGNFLTNIQQSLSVTANTWTTISGPITVVNAASAFLQPFVLSNQGTSTFWVAFVIVAQSLLSNGSGWSLAMTSNNPNPITTPAVPASGTPVTNTVGVGVQVTVTGGTGTNVAINGVLQGTFDGTYTVPSGGTITLTYTVAPTWNWFNNMYLTHAPAGGGGTLVGSFDYYANGVVPTGWWKLNDLPGSASAADYSGSGFNGTPTAVTFGQLQAVAPWTSARFNGTTSKIVTGYTPPALAALSVGFWVNYDNQTQGGTFTEFVNSSHTDISLKGFDFYQNNQNGFMSFALGNGTTKNDVSAIGMPADGWHFVVGTYDGTTQRLYVDGVQVAASTALTGSVASDTFPVQIGSSVAGGSNFLNGLMSEVLTDNTAWTPTQITNMYNGGINFQASALGVLPGQFVDASAQYLAASVGRVTQIAITFWTAGSSFISGQYVHGPNDNTSSWVTASSLHAQVPAGAMWARLETWVLNVTNAFETHYVYNATIQINKDVQGWGLTNGSGSVAQDNSWSQTGTYSLGITGTGTGALLAGSPVGTAGQPVTPGDYVGVEGTVFVKAGTVNQAGIEASFYNSSGTFIGNFLSPQYTLGAGAYDTFRANGIVPQNAVTMSVKFGDYANGIAGRQVNGDLFIIGAQAGSQRRDEPRWLVHEIEKIDRGIMREEKKLWGLGYRTRINIINQTPTVTLDYTKAHLFAPLAPSVDDQKIANDITIHRHKGSKVRVVLTQGAMSIQEPPNGIGRRSRTIRHALHDDAQLLNLANFLLNLATNADERYPTVTVDMVRTEMAGIMDACAAVEVGDYIQMIHLPFWYPNAKAKQLVIGYTETINPFDWTIQWNCTPESPYEIQVLRRW